ncbi:MAG: class I SAM-dependent methyltransferase [Bacteroidota bacterium]
MPADPASASRVPTGHLGAVEETLMIPLVGRAMEMDRSRPVLRDPKAQAIVAALDYDFAKFDGPSARGAVLRTRIYDRIVERWMAAHPGGTVVEIGCGLNTRFERVDDGRVRWRDLDVPDVIALWHRFFDETERRRAIASSAFETEWMDALAAETDGPVLFASEASTLFVPAETNQKLYADLAARFPGAHVFFDTATRYFAERQDGRDAFRHCTARVTWTVEEVSELEAWGLQVEESFPLFRPSRWLRGEVPRLYRVMGAVASVVKPAFVRQYRLTLAQLPGTVTVR